MAIAIPIKAQIVSLECKLKSKIEIVLNTVYFKVKFGTYFANFSQLFQSR